MNDHVCWHVELGIREGREQAFRDLTERMIETAKTERGVVAYERFLSHDSRTVHVYERYVDASAAVEHLELFLEQFGAEFAQLIERRHFTVMGAVSDRLRDILQRFDAEFALPMAGFHA